MKIQELKDNELIIEAKHLYRLCYVEDVYSTHDLLNLQLVYEELEKRGYEIDETKELNITKVCEEYEDN